jgi:hypothetical protein
MRGKEVVRVRCHACIFQRGKLLFTDKGLLIVFHMSNGLNQELTASQLGRGEECVSTLRSRAGSFLAVLFFLSERR